MTGHFDKHILKNGMVLLGEPMESVESAAFDFALPAGSSRLPDGFCGAANIIADWIFRGAGDKNNRQLGDALDGLGLHRSSSVGSAHLSLSGVLENTNLYEAICLFADIILKPALDNEHFELAKELAISDLLALDDDPQQKVMLKLRELFYPYPLGRSTAGNLDELKNLTAEKTRHLIRENFNLSETIFSVAGKYNLEKLTSQLEKLFSTGTAKKTQPIEIRPQEHKYTHIHNDGAQVHIGLMTPTVTASDENYYNARVAVSVLSGGMSARLFTEVREKRGLCYAIAARYHGLRESAGIVCYAGTTPDKAQQTIDCILEEFERLKEQISEEEIQRAKAGLKSSLILQSESSSSRAIGIGSDYYLLGRVRSLDEIKQNIEACTVDSVLGFLRKKPFRNFTIVTIGPKEIIVQK